MTYYFWIQQTEEKKCVIWPETARIIKLKHGFQTKTDRAPESSLFSDKSLKKCPACLRKLNFNSINVNITLLFVGVFIYICRVFFILYRHLMLNTIVSSATLINKIELKTFVFFFFRWAASRPKHILKFFILYYFIPCR